MRLSIIAVGIFGLAAMALSQAPAPAAGAAGQAPAPAAAGRGAGGRGGGGRGAANAAAPAADGQEGAAPAARGGGGGRVLTYIEAPDLGYKPTLNPLPLPPGVAFGAVAGVLINSQQHIFVYFGTRAELDTYRTTPWLPLAEFDADGKFIRNFGANLESKSPHGFRMDNADNLWVTDIQNHTVRKLNSKGEILMTLGTLNKSGVWDEKAGAHLFNAPTDLALAPNGDIFVAQGHGGGDPAVLRFDKNGKYITQWSGKVTGPAAFGDVHAILIDPQGRVWVGNRSSKKILIFDVDGHHLSDIQFTNYVCSLYVNKKDGQLYMLSGWDGQILKMDWTGKVLAVTGKPGKGLNMYGEAEGMDISAKGEIYVADKVNDYVQKLVPIVKK